MQSYPPPQKECQLQEIETADLSSQSQGYDIVIFMRLDELTPTLVTDQARAGNPSFTNPGRSRAARGSLQAPISCLFSLACFSSFEPSLTLKQEQ